MCMAFKVKYKEKMSWLKNGKSTITAYKVVNKRDDGRYYPLVYNTATPFLKTKMTKIKKEPLRKLSLNFVNSVIPNKVFKWNTSYTPYFHLFLQLTDAKNWKMAHNIILECEVPKKEITAGGFQDGQVIVTKAFKIIGEI